MINRLRLATIIESKCLHSFICFADEINQPCMGVVQFTVRVQLNIEQLVEEELLFFFNSIMQANWWQLSASGSAFDFRGCWADVRGSQKSSVHNIVDLASHMFVGDVMPSRLVSISQ
ncbi:hypothetical protein T09_14099 [Trichinella sp. T9]|nr:hypothetical protein T09_14099 [Trichinella sp. T9]